MLSVYATVTATAALTASIPVLTSIHFTVGKFTASSSSSSRISPVVTCTDK